MLDKLPAIFRPHIPILDDIKRKGLKQALQDTADDVVTRVTAGLSPADIRGVLRDDPAPRPNPRMKPHDAGFWLHMKPTYYHNLVDGLYPTFRLGWLATFFFVWEILTGIYLMIFYTASPLVAYENMLNILSNVPFGRFMRDTHKLGGELMVITVVLHMLRTFVTGSYKKPRQFTWATGGMLLIVTLFISFFGYLLPWDQLSLWAVTIGASTVGATPLVGREMDLLLRGGPEIGANGLLRAYLLHVIVLPLVGIITFGVHYYKVILHGHSLPPGAEEIGEDTARKVPVGERTYFMPKILTRELAYVSVLVAVMVAASAFRFGYHAPLEPHSNPLVTPLHTTSPWYFLWIQGMMKLGDKVIFGVFLPFMLILPLIVVWPYIELGPSRRYGHRRVGLSIAAFSLIGAAVLSFMGTPLFAVQTSPDQEAVAALLPQTKPGPLRTVNWDALILGTYEASNWQSAPTSAMRNLLHLFDEQINHVNAAERYRNAEGFMIIENWQTDLKKVTLRVVWTDGGTGEPAEFSESQYLHRFSDYGHGE